MHTLRTFLVRAALVLSLLLPLYFAASALAVKFDLLDWRVGFGLLTLQMGPIAIIAVLAISVVALLAALFVRPASGVRLALLAVLIPALALGYGFYGAARARNIPPIHDVTTDIADPPAFSAAAQAARARVEGVNGLDFSTKRVPENPRFGAASGQRAIDLHRAAYGDLAPIAVSRSPGDALAAARAAAERLGWRVVREDPAAGTLEAEVESFWFGFVDDVVVRVRATDEGSIVDVRSVSRVGVSDLGANAARIRAFREELAPQG